MNASPVSRVAATVLLLLFALVIIVPWQGALDRIGDAADVAPVPTARGYTAQALAILSSGAWWRVEPDYSLFLVRNVEFARRNADQWHLVSAYGPWSFLFRGYHPANYVPLVAAWTFFGVVSVLLAKRSGSAIAFALIVVLAANPRPALLMVLPLLVFRAYFSREDRTASMMIVTGIVAAALMGLVKSSSLVLGVIVAIAIGIDQCLRRRVPWVPLAYMLSFVAFWILCGQDLAWLGPFLRGTWHVSATYDEAEFSGSMASSGLLLPLCGVVVIASELRSALQRRQRSDLLGVAALSAIVLAFMKTALVRDDMFHAELAPVAAAALLILYAPALTDSIRAHRRAWIAAILVASVAIVLPYLPPVAEWKRQSVALGNPWAARRRSDGLYARDLASIAARSPLPNIPGTVDVYGERQSIAVAHTLNYRPRPVYQSYIAYDEYLAKWNAEHLRGSQAPDFILFSMSRSDERFPSLDDGLSWPDLLTRYAVAGVSPEIALLQRRRVAGTYDMRPCGIAHAALGERVQVPAGCDGLLWMNIKVGLTLRGRILATIYKVPEITLSVTTRDGEHFAGRLIRRTAAAGFLISPVIVGPVDFAAVVAGRADTVAPRTVERLIVDSKAGRSVYDPRITLEMYRLSVK